MKNQPKTLVYTRDVIVARRTSPEPNRHQRRHLVRLGQINPISFLRGYALAQCITASPIANAAIPADPESAEFTAMLHRVCTRAYLVACRIINTTHAAADTAGCGLWEDIGDYLPADVCRKYDRAIAVANRARILFEELLERAAAYYDAQYEAEMVAARSPEGEEYYQHCLNFCLARPALSISRLTCHLCEESGDKFGGVGESLARYAAKVASALAALEA